MSIYTYNGAEFSEDDVIAKAKEKGMDLDSYINKFGIERIDTEGPGKKKPAVVEDVAVAGKKNTASKSDPFLLEQQRFNIKDPIGVNKTFPKQKPDLIRERIEKWDKTAKPKNDVFGPKDKDYGYLKVKDQSKIGDYLTSSLRTKKANETLFGVEEEEGKKALEKLYAGIPGLTFEETNKIGGDISNMFDAVKAVYVDPVTGEKKESDILQFDISALNASAEDRPKLANKNADILKDFFNKNLKNVNLAKNKALREQSKLLYNKELNNSITPEFKAEVNAKFDAPDLFAPVERTYKGTAAGGGFAMGTGGGGSYIVKPYENELNLAKKQILAKNPKISKEDLAIQAEKEARNILKASAINSKKADYAESIIAKDNSLQAQLYVGSLLSNEEAVRKQNRDTVKLKVAENNEVTMRSALQSGYSIMQGNAKTEAELQDALRKFRNAGVDVNLNDTELVTLKNGVQVYKGFYDASLKLEQAYKANNLYAEQVFKDQNKNLEKLQNSDIFSTAAAKNYDLSEKYLTNIGAGITDIATGASYFTAKVLAAATPLAYVGDEVSKLIYGEDAQTTSGKLDEWAVNYTKAVGDIRQSYVRDVAFEDAFSSASNFGKFAAQEISQQIPILMAMAATGGAAGIAGVSGSGASSAMIGVFGAGGKMAEMQTEMAKGSADYSNAEIWLKSIGFGASEALFERATTIPILKRAKTHFATFGTEDVLDTSMKAYFKSKTPGFVYDQFLESAGEVGTTITQNIIDGKPVMENVAHSAFSGFGMGTVISGVPYTHGLYLSAFSDYNSKQEIRNLNTELKDLGKQFELTKNRAPKKAIAKLMDAKQQEINVAIEKQQSKINENLRAGAAQSIIYIENEKAKLQNEAKSIVDDKSIESDLKEILIKDLRTKFNLLNNTKERALDPTNLMQDKSKFILLEASEPVRYNGLIDQATFNLSQKGNTTPEMVQKEAYELYLSQEIDINIRNASKVEGVRLLAFDTKAEAVNFIQNSEDVTDAEKPNAVNQIQKGGDGFNVGDLSVVVKENMLANQRTQIGSHEVGHTVFNAIFKNNPEAFIPIANQILLTTEKLDKKLYKKLIKNTDKVGSKFDAQEVVSRFLESVSSGDVSFAEKKNSFLSGLFGSMIQKEFINEYDFDFKGQTDMFNFVVGLGKKIKDGTLTLKEIEAASESQIAKATVNAKDFKNITLDDGSVSFSKAKVDEVQAKIDILEDQFDNDQIEYDDYTSRLENLEKELEKAKATPDVETKPKIEKQKQEISSEEEVKQIIKENRSSIASDKVQKIYDTKGTDGAQDIINLFKPITKKIVDKRRDAPDFDRELLTDEIETGVGGILDLITKYNPESGTPLAAYINKYLPVRAIATSKRLLGKEFSKDVTEEKALIAEETVTEVKEKPKYANALESKVFDKEVIEAINKKILSVVRTLKSRIDAPISINRTVSPLITEIRDEIGKQVDIDVKTAMGGKKDNQLKNWLLKNKKYVLENMTTTWLMGLDGKGGIPQAIQKQIDGKWVNYPEWVGKKIDRESVSTDNAGRTSGAELVRRLPNVNNNVSNEDFLAQVLETSGNPIRGRKESLAKAIAEEASFDIILDDFENEGPIFQAFEANQERQGVEVKEVIKTDFLRQVERGNIKFSLSPKAKIDFDNNVDNLFDAISLKGRITKAKLRRIVNNVFPEWVQEDKDEVINKFGPYIRSAIQTIGRKYREKESIKAAKTKDAIRAFAEDVDDGAAIGTRLGVPSVTANLKNSEHIKELQDINIDFGQQLLKDVGQREGLELLASFWYPSVAGRTKDDSKSIFKGKGSFRQFLQDIQDGFNNKIKFEDLNIDRKTNAVTKDMVEGTVSSESKANDIRISDNAWDFTNRAIEFFANEVKDPNNGYSNKHLASLLTLLIYERNSALRSAAPATGAIIDPRIKNIKKYDYDHSVPARYVLSRLMDKYVDGKNVDLNKLKKDYVVTVIPLTMTKSLKDAGLQSMMPYDYKDGDGADSRLQYGNKDISRTIKFSLSTKANLKWENQLGVASTNFKAGGYNYNIKTAPVKSYGIDGEPGMNETFKKIANNLDIPLEQLTNNKNFNWVSFAENDMGSGILNTGNAFKVFGIVSNGLIDYIEKNNIEGIAFSADSTEPSRVRLYKTLASTIGSKLGWNYTAVDSGTKENGIVFVINSYDSDSFKNQSELQKEKIKFSKTISPRFNKIIEENKGVEDYKNFSDIVARRRGAGKNILDIYVPASAADFELLLYNFIGKGAKGEEQKKFFTDTLLKPYANGSDLMDAARQSIKNEYKQLLSDFPDVAKKIEKRTPDGDFTYDQAIRVAMWNEEGAEIPGLSQRDSNKLTDLVNNDPELKAFKDALIVTGRQGRGWVKPEQYWDANTIITDLHNLTEGEGRKKFLSEFIANAEEMFGKFENGKLVGPNINKVEAVYGTDVREALEDVLYRMTTGKNKSFGKDKETSNWANWVSGSTGAIMFLNVRSAALQLIGAVNFLNLRDNNPYAAAKAFANQKQYWEDFARIWNSDKMKERRGGLKEDVAAAEIANAAAGSKNKVGAVLSYLLKIGYTPTQMADSFAIASGGAPFYRNRIKSYLKEGMTEQDAENAAWDDFTKVSDETQQSGDPRDISKQQASPAGRLLLTFQNTAMQQSRIVKKAVLDLKNGRGDAKTNFAKIAYYVAIQNTMFAVLQQGLFAVAFGYDDEDDEIEYDAEGKKITKKEKELNEKLFDVADGVIDTILRGTGFMGGIVATVKNMAKKYLDERDKKFKADYAKVVLEGANLSPPIGSKLRKLYSGLQQTKFDKDLIEARGWDVMQDGRVNVGPMYSVTGKVVEAFTNVPMDRLVTKVNNASEAMNSQNTTMQRIMIGLGWSPYSAGIEDSPGDKKIREEAKAKRKIEGVEKAKETRQRTKDSIRQLPVSEQLRLRKEAALERREKRRRRKMG
jgi:hypothetical protein